MADRDTVRLLIFDREPPGWTGTPQQDTYKKLFSDTEIDTLLGLYGSDVFKTAAQCLRTMAADSARRAISFDVLRQNLRVDRTLTPGHLLKVAEHYDKMANARPYSILAQWTDGDREYIDDIVNFDEFDMEDSYS